MWQKLTKKETITDHIHTHHTYDCNSAYNLQPRKCLRSYTTCTLLVYMKPPPKQTNYLSPPPVQNPTEIRPQRIKISFVTFCLPYDQKNSIQFCCQRTNFKLHHLVEFLSAFSFLSSGTLLFFTSFLFFVFFFFMLVTAYFRKYYGELNDVLETFTGKNLAIVTN